MEKFAQGDIKILICTNIVESGLDIQNANTIIIQDVQQFGLAQLYQVQSLSLSLYFALNFPKNLNSMKAISTNCSHANVGQIRVQIEKGALFVVPIMLYTSLKYLGSGVC